MKRVSGRRAEIGVALFPFLAVLICMMGALIVLLVLVVQQARVQADTICNQMADQVREQQQAERLRQEQEEEDYRWKQEILQQQRHELTERLSDGRMQLGHLEDHIRRLEKRWRELHAELLTLQMGGDDRQEDRATADRELVRLQAELDAERRRLDEAREQLAKRRRSFSIIPYDGPHGTRRRPIYIECRETGITIQPEGIVLGPQDFSGPLGPGNPLDASLRAIREYWNQTEGQSKLGEPYPLLIVRSDGAVAYSMARAAMANWDDEFGYELVGADVPLDFPAADPQLRSLLETTVQTARQRQAMLAAAMPRRFSAPAPEGFRMDDIGTNWDDGGPASSVGGVRNGGSRGRGAAGDTPAGSRGMGAGINAGTGGGTHAWSTDAGGAGGSAGAMRTRGSSETMQHGQNSGQGSSQGPGQGMGPTAGQAMRGGNASAGTANGPSGMAADGSAAGGGGSAAGGGGSAAGGGGSAAGAGGSAAGAGAHCKASGQGGATAGTAGGSAADSDTAASGASAQFTDPESLPQAIARQRGVNWALPNAPTTATGITRPILVECHRDGLVILPDRDDTRDPQTIPVQGAMRGSIQPFVTGIWSHTERWGMAVAGGYWKPVIRVRVAPDAHARFRELEALLQDSGIDVEQR